MDFTALFHAALLGIVEGLTEFLPVFSTGHLILSQHALGLMGDFWEMFEVVIQLGAILAVCWYYKQRLLDVALHLNRKTERDFALKLFVALIPSLVIGGLFHSAIKHYLFSPTVVAVSLIVGGIVIWIVEKKKPEATVLGFEEISFRRAFLIGCAQTLAVIPGTSRSGATIIGGILLKLNRRVATEFSFFLAIPTMVAASALDILKNHELLDSQYLGLLGVGFVVSFLSALAAIRLFLAFVSRHDFTIFAYYRIVIGVIMLWYFGGAAA